MSLIAFVTDPMAIGKILEHLGLSRPQAAKPPPPSREVLRVAEHAHGPAHRGAGSVESVVPAAPPAQPPVGPADQNDYRSP
jgi:hypothetical protein